MKHVEEFLINGFLLKETPVSRDSLLYFLQWLHNGYLDAPEDATQEALMDAYVRLAPGEWPTIMIDLLVNPPAEGMEWIDVQCWLLLGLWGRQNPNEFFALAAPHLNNSAARPILLSAMGEMCLPESVKWLRPLVATAEILTEDEMVRLLDVLGCTQYPPEMGARELLLQLQSKVSPQKLRVHHELSIFLKYQ
jgi:hypothetical protein